MKKNLILLLVLILLGITAVWIYKKNTGSTISGEPLTGFAVQDTSQVTKFFIADHFGKTALLERVPGQKLWKLNGKYLAREDAVKNILEVFQRIRVRGNVPQKGKDNMMKIIATSGMKVEIYTGKDRPAKIYYIGSSTPDHFGTIMLLEIPGIGRSSEPYITHMEGFTGFLNPRFFTDENEWRYTGIFEYPDLGFNEITFVNHLAPETSFRVTYNGQNNIRLFGSYSPNSLSFNKNIPDFDTLAVKDLLIRFKKVHVDSYATNLKPAVIDSILKMPPVFTIQLKDNRGEIKSVDLFMKKAKEPRQNAQGIVTIWDPEYFWARTPSGELALAQVFVFDPLILPIDAYYTKLRQ
ncbi:MAG: hypothetical protein IT223_07145 [Crocinitomicaceae bacterium]|nr:hypothetical protein [Crocinitomicaceae bacterium]